MVWTFCLSYLFYISSFAHCLIFSACFVWLRWARWFGIPRVSCDFCSSFLLFSSRWISLLSLLSLMFLMSVSVTVCHLPSISLLLDTYPVSTETWIRQKYPECPPSSVCTHVVPNFFLFPCVSPTLSFHFISFLFLFTEGRSTPYSAAIISSISPLPRRFEIWVFAPFTYLSRHQHTSLNILLSRFLCSLAGNTKSIGKWKEEKKGRERKDGR